MAKQGAGTKPSQHWRGKPLNSNSELPDSNFHLLFPYSEVALFCCLLALRNACLQTDRQTDILTAAASQTPARALVAADIQPWQSAGTSSIARLSPTALKLALHIRVKIQHFLKEELKELKNLGVFCLFLKTDDKCNIFKEILLWKRHGESCRTQHFSEEMSWDSQKLPLSSHISQWNRSCFSNREDFELSEHFKMLILRLVQLIPVHFCHQNCNSLTKFFKKFSLWRGLKRHKGPVFHSAHNNFLHAMASPPCTCGDLK